MLLRCALMALLCMSACVRGYGQSAVDGAIGGTVEDKSGSVIPRATVEIRNNATNTAQRVATDDQGFYRAIHLQPGVYTVTVSMAGYETFRAAAVTVEVGSLSDPHVQLTVGAASTTIDVTSAEAQINTTSPDFASTVDQKVLQDLPVNNYRWSSYALLTPGVVADSSGFGLLSFRGQSTLLNNVTFDGADDNQAFFSEERGRTRAGYSTAKTSIQEFQVNTSNYSVEYGRSAGGVVNAVTKSGSNQFHGEAYFFDRDAGWGSVNPFNTHAVETNTNPVTYSVQPFKPKDWRKQFGGGVGGAIVRDKLFFFFAGDAYKRNFPGVSAPSSPALFYTLPDVALPTGSNCTASTLSAIDAAACQLAANLAHTTLAKVTPAQYTTGANDWTSGIQGLNSITGLTPRTGDQSILFPKLDWQINGKNHAAVEMNRLRWTSPAGIQTSTSALSYGVASFGNDYVKDTFLIGKLDSALTSRISNEVRYQYGRDFEYEYNQTPTAYEKSTLLTPPGYTNPFGIPPYVSITNGLQLGTATFLNRPSYPDERRWQASDTVNFVRGNHNLKFGLDFIHTNDLSQNLTAAFGSYTYGGSNFTPFTEYFTDLNTTNGCSTTINKVVTPIECYTAYSQGFGPLGFEFQTKDYAFFAQDEWKFNPRLSLTLGLRYEYEQLPNPQLPNPTVDAQLTNGSTSIFPSNKANIGPRAGFAWDVYGTGKTVVRGGAGEFFARVINSTIYNAIAQTGNSAGQLSISLTNSATAPGPIFPQVVSPSYQPQGATAVYYFDKNFKLPEIWQADLTVQQDLGWNTTFSATWLSAFGRRLPNFVDSNLPAATGTISYTVVDKTGKSPIPNGTVVTMPFYGKLATTSNGRPDAAYGSSTDIYSGVNSNYEALVAEIQHRFAHRVQFDANYTWSHALDYGENNTTFTNANSQLDPYNLRLDYGNSNQNVPDRLVLNGIYETPSSFHGVWAYLLNQYEISPSFAAQSGLPYSAGVSGSTSGLFSQVNGVTGTTAAIGSSINGSGGTNRVPGLDRNYLQQPRTMVLDMRLSKRFSIAERAKLEILGEAFNVANHLNITSVNTTAFAYAAGAAATKTTPAGPNTLTYNTPFGTATGANGNLIYSVRLVQLGARLQF
ncbi:MAG TPA: TonB-dependent receptor [Granulicella sp.]|nr:TonB-dependent receptor [Granulicella sp.]